MMCCSLEKGIEFGKQENQMQLIQLAKSLLNTNEFSASRYLDEIKTDKFNSKDKLRDPTLI